MNQASYKVSAEYLGFTILGFHTYHCNKLQRGPYLHQIHQHGLIRNLSIRPKPVILFPSFCFLQELWEYRFGGWGVLSKGLRSCCHEPTILLGERDVHWTRQLSSHACVVPPPENLTFLCPKDADNTPCLHLIHKTNKCPCYTI